MTLEVCAYNIRSCRIAEKAGAKRIELCADAVHGGTTPSHGLVEFALNHLSIPVFPMIRPRGGNFIYDEDEIAIMKRDIKVCKELGCTGLATGVQLPDRTIDVEQLKRIVEWAYPMSVTCHKVFDRTPDAFNALEDVIAAGCSRILTSGLAKTATEGAAVLTALVQQAKGRIVIMPGGGVRSSNIAALAKETGAVEFHSSALLAGSIDYVANEEEVRLLVAGLRV